MRLLAAGRVIGPMALKHRSVHILTSIESANDLRVDPRKGQACRRN